jgi:hypothetical protein
LIEMCKSNVRIAIYKYRADKRIITLWTYIRPWSLSYIIYDVNIRRRHSKG